MHAGVADAVAFGLQCVHVCVRVHRLSTVAQGKNVFFWHRRRCTEPAGNLAAPLDALYAVTEVW